MAKWWDRRWRLVIGAILLPMLLVPIVSALLFPETPFTRSFLNGALLSSFVASAFSIVYHVETLGSRIVLLVMSGALITVLVTLTLRIWKY